MIRIFFNTFVLLLICSQLITITDVFAKNDSHTAIAQTHLQNHDCVLNPDPSIVRGRLENGLRYMIKENHEPADRVAAYLVVMAGSNEEGDDQQGVAHFLEHLMFNGSDNFPPGTLVDYFQSIGMDFGGDTNAYTGFDRTVYHLILPTGDNDELAVGCKILADYARGALLLDSEIDKERGVIFSEKRSRDSASYRNRITYTNFAFEGTRYPTRLPIGIETVLQSADHDLLKRFYDDWYRPENIALVLVGDLDIKSAEKIITQHFEELTGVGEMPPRPEFGKLKHKGLEVLYNYEPELGSTNVSIESIWDLTPAPVDCETKRGDIYRIIADLILGYRLQEEEEGGEQPYVAAQYSTGDIAGRIGYGSIYAVTEESKWRGTLEKISQVLEYARRYGFTDGELERAKSEIYSRLDKNVKTASSLHSRVIAERIVNNLLDQDVYMSPKQEFDFYVPILEETTVDDIHKSFIDIWDKPDRLVTVTGDVKLSEPESQAIKGDYIRLAEKVVEKKEATQKKVFPYLELSETKASVQKIEKFPGIDMTRYILTNGLIINYKKTEYEPHKVRLSANFGVGEQGEYMPGASAVAGDVIRLSGTQTLSLSDLETVGAQSSVDLSFRIGRSSSSWSGSGLSSDFTFMVQLLHALLLDSGFDKTAYTKVMQRKELMQHRLAKDIDGAVLYNVQPFFAGGNKHYGLLPWEELNQLKFEQLQSWAEDIFDFEDLEISVVGDIDASKVVSLMSTYFGSLSLGDTPTRMMEEHVTFPSGEALRMTVDSEIKKSIVFLSWPTDDFWDIAKTRRLSILSSVLEDRVRKVVREELGASYSPSVSSYGSRMHRGYGLMQIEIEVKDGKEEVVLLALKKLVAELLRDGVTLDELERAKKPILTSVYENIQTNQYWLYSVLSLSTSFKEQLQWPTNIVSDIKSINVSEMNALLQEYIQSSALATAIVNTKVIADQTSKAEKGNDASTQATVN